MSTRLGHVSVMVVEVSALRDQAGREARLMDAVAGQQCSIRWLGNWPRLK